MRPARESILLLLLAPLATMACGRGQANVPPADEPFPVRIAAVETESVSPPIHATGILGPKEEVHLSFKIGGVIERIAVDEGDRVRAGEPLAALDLREIDAHVAQAQSGLEKAERDLSRARRLYADSVVTLEQVQDAQTGFAVAQAAFDALLFDRRHAVILAPSDGIVLRRFSEVGEMVAPGGEILIVGSSARGSVVRAGLADRDAIRVRRGDTAIVTFDLQPPRSVRGAVCEIAAAADPATGTFRVEVTVPGVDLLASGLVANVEIRPDADRPLALIPVDALLEADGKRATVFALSGSTSRARRREIAIAFLSGDQVAVTSGLEGVDHVVTDGAPRLDDGDSVKVMP